LQSSEKEKNDNYKLKDIPTREFDLHDFLTE